MLARLSHLPILCPGAVRVKNTALVINIAGVEELIVAISWLAPIEHVSFHGIQVPDSLGKFDM